MSSLSLHVIRGALSIVGAISPRAAGRLAFRLFSLTPSRRPKGEKAKAAHAAGRLRLADGERIDVQVGRKRIATFRFNGGPMGRRPRYLVVHGWGSSTEYMSELITTLAATGAEIIAVDFPGHGRSSGRYLTMVLAVRAIEAVQKRFGAFDAAIGHSFGGASLMVATSGLLPGIDRLNADKLALIGSPSAMQWLFTDFGTLLHLKPATQKALEQRVESISGRRLEDFDAAQSAGTIRKPILILHAEDDKEVDADHGRAYAAAGSHVQLQWMNGFGHRRILSAAPVFAALSAFLGDGDVQEQVDTPVMPLSISGRRLSS